MRRKYCNSFCADSEDPSHFSMLVSDLRTDYRVFIPPCASRSRACACLHVRAQHVSRLRQQRRRDRRGHARGEVGWRAGHAGLSTQLLPAHSLAELQYVHTQCEPVRALSGEHLPQHPPAHRHAPSQPRHRQICSATLNTRHIMSRGAAATVCTPRAGPRAARLLEAALQAAVEGVVQRREGRAGQHLCARPPALSRRAQRMALGIARGMLTEVDGSCTW
jgi:hypothetical protein